MNNVLYWNAIALEASRRDHSQGYANGQQGGPTATSRALAIAHLAMHDALAYIVKPGAAYLKKKYNIGMTVPPGSTAPDAIDGAAITALKAMYPAYGAFFDDALVSNSLTAGFEFGKTVAQRLLTERAGDGASALPPAAAPITYGAHRADPYNPQQSLLGAHWGNVAHFVGPRLPLADFPGRGLPSYLANAHYRQDYEEVRDVGATARGSRSAEQTLIGVYWGYDGAQGLGVPPRLYNQIARKVFMAMAPMADAVALRKAAELFAEINVAMADSAIDAWHYKYVNNLWRPVVGIRHEPANDGDCFWGPLGAPQTNRVGAPPTTPPFPAYPSGHATFGAALFQTLRLRLAPGAAPITTADVLDAEDGGQAQAGESFTFVSDELDGRAVDVDGSLRTRHDRSVTSYARAIYENAISRVYLGVHWRLDGLPRMAGDNIGGVPLGLAIGQQVHDYFNDAPSLNGAN